MSDPADSQKQVYLSSLFQQYQTNTDLLLKHQLDSKVKSKEAQSISERILLLHAQVLDERVNLDALEKERAKDLKVIDEICGCDRGPSSSVSGMEVRVITHA
jgi:hypothetical protein